MKRLTAALILMLALASAPALVRPAAAAESIVVESDTVVRDQAGRRIVVHRPFARIIALYGAHTANLFSMGHGGRLVGVSALSDDPPEADRLPVFSHRDDPEKFLATRPDLVLSRPMIGRAYPNLIRRLEQTGITVVSLQPASIEQMYTYWEALGVLVGDPCRARAMVAAFKANVAAIEKLARAVVRPKRVFFEAIHDKMKTFSPGSMPLFALAAVGAVNVAADAEPSRGTNIANYGKERIMARGDQIDVYLAQVGPMNPITRDQILTEPGFAVIRAVREGCVFLVDEGLVARPTPRLVQGMLQIGRMLYPEIFTAAACRRLGAGS